MRLNAHKGWRKTSVATASSRCNETRRQGCRRHLRAERPTFSSDGFQPLYDTNARQGCRAHFKSTALSGLNPIAHSTWTLDIPCWILDIPYAT